jgi:hypothetical protein
MEEAGIRYRSSKPTANIGSPRATTTIEIRTQAQIPSARTADYEPASLRRDAVGHRHTIHAALGADGRPRRLPARVLQILR